MHMIYLGSNDQTSNLEKKNKDEVRGEWYRKQVFYRIFY